MMTPQALMNDMPALSEPGSMLMSDPEDIYKYVYRYMYMCTCVCIYIYIYISHQLY